jgi:hypothetical protein
MCGAELSVRLTEATLCSTCSTHSGAALAAVRSGAAQQAARRVRRRIACHCSQLSALAALLRVLSVRQRSAGRLPRSESADSNFECDCVGPSRSVALTLRSQPTAFRGASRGSWDDQQSRIHRDLVAARDAAGNGQPAFFSVCVRGGRPDNATRSIAGRLLLGHWTSLQVK